MLKARQRSVEARARARIPFSEEYYDALEYEIDPLGGFRLKRNQHLPHITINCYGYRGVPFNGQERVVLLGDSVTFGVGASGDHACFARYLETHIGQPVADASVRAYRVCQQFAQLPRLLSMLPQTQRAIVWCGYADLLFWATTKGCIEGAFQFERKYADFQRRTPLSAVLGSFLTVLGGSRRWRNRTSGDRERRAREVGSLNDLVAHVVMYILAIRDLCATRRINLSVLVQPFLRGRPSDQELLAIMDFYDAKMGRGCGVGWYEAAPIFVDSLMTLLSVDEGIDVIDCQRFVSEPDFLDQVHLRDSVLERIAARVAQAGESLECRHGNGETSQPTEGFTRTAWEEGKCVP